tara:strand:+ start:1592 stop:2170 length:579 start_codon:yes stop_codon:yes gene_type:complete
MGYLSETGNEIYREATLAVKPLLIIIVYVLIGLLPALANTGEGVSPHAGVSEKSSHNFIGSPSDDSLVTQEIEISIRETAAGYMLFVPDVIYIKKGSTVRFVITNTGAMYHEFYLGSFEEIQQHEQWMRSHPDMSHVDQNAVAIPAGEAAELVWKFSVETNLEFVCLIDGHREAGMWGVIIVHDHVSGSTAR